MTIPFDEFPPISKEAWLQQIAKDLKDKPLAGLDWHLTDDLVITPLVHADDQTILPLPLVSDALGWEICEHIAVADSVAANRQALEALEGGVESICFELTHPLESTDLSALLNNIYLDYIGLHFSGESIRQNPGILLGILENIAKTQNIKPSVLHGTLGYGPYSGQASTHHSSTTNTLPPDWRYLADLMQHTTQVFPRFKVIQISDTPYYSGTEHCVEELAALIQEAHDYITQLDAKGQSPYQTIHQIYFTVTISSSYFISMAKLRALRLIWYNLLGAWNLAPTDPYLEVVFDTKVYTDEIYSNMIRATSMAMSAVQGGANRITVLPYDADRASMAQYPSAFGRRIARNVQHLLKMESYLHEIPDPAAGSYYIERLTQQLAEKAWESIGKR